MNTEIKSISFRKRIVLLSLAGAVTITGIIGTILFSKANATEEYAYNPLSIKQVLALPKDSTCLVNNDAVKTAAQSQKGLGEDDGLWTSQIYDIPAGTNVDVNIASYTKDTTVAGSLAYPKQYGSYNFTVTRQADNWRYTEFTRCEQRLLIEHFACHATDTEKCPERINDFEAFILSVKQ